MNSLGGPEESMKKTAVLLIVSLVAAAASLVSGCSPVTGVTVHKPEKCYEGYTLMSSFGAHENPPGSGIFHGAILIDMDGDLVNEWPITGFPAKMLPDGHVMGYHAMRADCTGHQETDSLVVLDWYGNEVWRWDQWGEDAYGGPICRGHHDFEREGNPVGYYVPGMDPLVQSGKTLMLVHNNVERPDIAPWTIEDDVILEVNYEGDILWEWHATDHLDEFGFAWDARVALQFVQVPMPVILGGGADVTDWLHTNSISYLGPNRWWDAGDARFDPENIIADSRNANIIWIIDKATGDIVWKVGPDYSWCRPEWRLGQIIGGHHAHIIPKGLPGEGNILIFDNGGSAGYGKGLFGIPIYPNKVRSWSRVIEFDPITLDVVWEYRRLLPHWGENNRFYSFYISGAQRLPNGNTLITEGSTGRLFEVTASGELVWEYISPYYDLSYEQFHGTIFQYQNLIYRAYRVPYDYIPGELTSRSN